MSKQTDLINVTDAMAVSGSNVGIGTVNPSEALHVYDASAATDSQGIRNSTYHPHLTLEDLSSNAGDWQVWADSGDLSFLYGDVSASGTDGAKLTSEAMRIDSSGRVTTPYQPAFSAYLTADSAGAGQVVYDATLHNRGNNYNTSNGVFTAPVSGIYSFTAIAASGITQSSGFIYLSVNNNRSRDMFEGLSFIANTEYHATCEVFMSANDTASIKRGNAFTMKGGIFAYFSAFMGHLIG